MEGDILSRSHRLLAKAEHTLTSSERNKSGSGEFQLLLTSPGLIDSTAPAPVQQALYLRFPKPVGERDKLPNNAITAGTGAVWCLPSFLGCCS